MTRYRGNLPQQDGGFYLTDGGIETTLIFLEGLDLPHFAAFHLLRTWEGEEALRKYFRTYASLAERFGSGLILESATWRASADWGARLGYETDQVAEANRRAIALLEDIRAEYEGSVESIVISGCVGPRGDGYDPGKKMTAQEAQAYHSHQIGVFRETAADMITAIT